MLLEAKNISKAYKVGENEVCVLTHFNFSIKKGEKVAVIGPSGSGKSTLLNVLCGLDRCDEGEILFKDMDITKLKKSELTDLRCNNFGFIFQEFHLIETLNSLDNILVPVLAKRSKPNMEEVYSLCDELGLSERLEHFPYQLSGGEKQRVAIARAIVCKPSIIFSDEATGNLDKVNSKNVMDMINNCCNKYGLSLIYVTHDMGLVDYADKIVDLSGEYDER